MDFAEDWGPRHASDLFHEVGSRLANSFHDQFFLSVTNIMLPSLLRELGTEDTFALMPGASGRDNFPKSASGVWRWGTITSEFVRKWMSKVRSLLRRWNPAARVVFGMDSCRCQLCMDVAAHTRRLGFAVILAEDD